ncbi:MAG: hypothetical protein LBK94_00640 [Prevotellaceae bacterium]|jgi:hypothetical protein|nr:hypothetical protein [Prevotellaceae bacterium]
MKTSWIYWVALALFTALLGSVSKCGGLLKENARLEDNIEVLYSDIKLYKVNESLNAAGINRLYMTKSELERYNADLSQQIKDLNIKLKRVQSVSQTATETQYEIRTLIRDSIIYRVADSATVRDTLQCIDYRDAWLSVEGCENNGLATYNIRSVDTLIQVIHRIPKWFLVFRFGTKAIRQEIMSKNPHSRIVYTEYIEVK